MTFLKTLYLHCLNTYDYQTWQDHNLGWRNLAHEVKSSFNQVVEAQFWKSYICTFTAPMTAKLGSVFRVERPYQPSCHTLQTGSFCNIITSSLMKTVVFIKTDTNICKSNTIYGFRRGGVICT